MSKNEVRSSIFVLIALGLALTAIAIEVRTGAPGSDIRNLTQGAHNLMRGHSLSPKNLSLYPAFNYVIYLYLAFIPNSVLVPSTAVLGFLLILGALAVWNGDRPKLVAVGLLLLLSVPILQLLYIDQLNTAIGFSSLTFSLYCVRRNWWWAAGPLAVLSLICRPLNTVIILPWLFYLISRRNYILSVLTGGVVFIALLIVTWLLDHRFIPELLGSSHRRPLVGPIGFIRESYGVHGLVIFIILVAGCALYLGYSMRNADFWDSASLLFAFSLLSVHLGGQYIALYEIPIIFRLATRWSLTWIAFAYVIGYASVNVLYASLGVHFAILGPISIPWIMLPLFLALLAMYGMSRMVRQTAKLSPNSGN